MANSIGDYQARKLTAKVADVLGWVIVVGGTVVMLAILVSTWSSMSRMSANPSMDSARLGLLGSVFHQLLVIWAAGFGLRVLAAILSTVNDIWISVEHKPDFAGATEQ